MKRLAIWLVLIVVVLELATCAYFKVANVVPIPPNTEISP